MNITWKNCVLKFLVERIIYFSIFNILTLLKVLPNLKHNVINNSWCAHRKKMKVSIYHIYYLIYRHEYHFMAF